MSNQIQDIQEQLNWHWRNSMRTIRFFGFDARAALPLPLLMLHFRTWTVVLMIINLLLFHYLEKKGLTVPSALRSFRVWLIGKDRPGWIGAHQRKFIDHG